MPIVTASEGSPTTVTSRPLMAPPTAPASSAINAATGIGSPASNITPNSTLLRPAMLATDRSISPVMITIVIGRAMNRIGVTSSSRKYMVIGVPNLGTIAEATMITDEQERDDRHLAGEQVAASRPERRGRGRLRSTGATVERRGR